MHPIPLPHGWAMGRLVSELENINHVIMAPHCTIHFWRLFQYKVAVRLGIPMLTIRWSHDRLIFNVEIHIPGKDGLYIKTGPWFQAYLVVCLCASLHVCLRCCEPVLRCRTPAEGGAAEGDRADEQAPAEGANDSAAPGDLTADLTIDSVKVHLR